LNSNSSIFRQLVAAKKEGAFARESIILGLAWMVSIVFHPLLMPTYLNAIVFKYCTDILPLTREAKVQMLLFVFVSTYLIPAIATGLLWATGAISSLSLEKRSERLIPLMVTGVIYAGVSYVFLDYLSMARLLGLFMGTIALTVILTAFITHFWKISSHMVGVGGLVGFLFSVVLETHNLSLEYPLIGSIGVAGAVASSRLYLKAHSIKQIIAGFLLGIVLSWSAVYFFV